MEYASQIFWRKANEMILEMEKHAGNERQLKEDRKVAGQLLFYAGINAIEEVLSAKISAYAVGDHKKRGILLAKNLNLFPSHGEKILRYYRILTEHETDYRRKVAYKGENGNKFVLLQEFSRLCIEEVSHARPNH